MCTFWGKTVVIVNGEGSSALYRMAKKHFDVMDVSSVTPVKGIAGMCGWKGERDEKSKRLLSELKRITAEYNDFPTRYLWGRYREFRENDDQIMFVHIREEKEIYKFSALVDIRCLTMLVVKDFSPEGRMEEDSEFPYDIVFRDNGDPEDTERRLVKILSDELADQQRLYA